MDEYQNNKSPQMARKCLEKQFPIGSKNCNNILFIHKSSKENARKS